MSTPVTNFGKATVSTGYDAAATSIALTAGHGSRLPSTFPYPLTWWNFTDYPDPADDPNREIVTVTNRSGDTLTVTRGAESTGASTKNTVGKTYKMLLGLTKAMYDALQARALSQTFRGLRVQTHPDADVAAKKVLFNADAIVLSDGEEVANWANVAADITASGANGLDTGSEQASTWYSIWAIYNGSTKAGLLHREKDYFLDEDASAGEDASQGIRSAVDNSTIRVAQGFQVDTAGPIPFVDVKLVKTGTPTGNIWFTIEANNGGVPSNTPLATSSKYDVSRITTSATWVRIVFPTPVSVSAATQYHLVAYGDWTVSAANFISWRMDSSAATYANGAKALFDSDTSTWTTDTDDDMTFKVYVTRNDTALTLPSGYTQYALLGYVLNNASSNFKAFVQVQNQVFCGYDDSWQIGAFTNTTPELIDLRQFVPPRPVMLTMLYYNGTASDIVIGTVVATDLSSTPTDEKSFTSRVTVNTTFVESLGPIPVEYAAMMMDLGAGTANLYVNHFTF